VHAYIRVDQSGYATQERKYAYVMAPQRLPGEVVDVVSDSGQSMMTAQLGTRKAWSSRFPCIYRVDFSPLAGSGRYSLNMRGTTVQAPLVPGHAREGLVGTGTDQGTGLLHT
jgi:hypothetical protein